MAIGLLGLLGLSAISSLVNTGINHIERRTDRNYNAEQAKLAHERSIEADSTKYQRAMEDMKEAGLNPAMMYASGGAGIGSTPTSATASTSAAHTNNLVGQIGTLMNSITNARALEMQSKKTSSNKTTQEIYNSLGELMKVVVTNTRGY